MINLIPPDIKRHHKRLSRIYSLAFIYIAIIAGLGFAAGGMGIYNFSLKSAVNDKHTQVDDQEKQKTTDKELVSQASFIEDRYKSSPTFHDTKKWDVLLGQIAQATPTNIQLTGLQLAIDPKKPTLVTIKGLSPDRRSALLFKDKLTALNIFISVDLTDLTQAKSADQTSFSFTIQAVLGSSTVSQSTNDSQK
jgi:Tfp pilus assembly protein PilN